MDPLDYNYRKERYEEMERTSDKMERNRNPDKHSLLTNFNISKIKETNYIKAAEESGFRVFIKKEAYDIYGRIIPNMNSLHSYEKESHKDFSPFWRRLEEIEKNG